MANTGDRSDPFLGFNFLVQIDGFTLAGFSEASGLTTETTATEYRTGAEEPHVRQLPGLTKFGPITLKRGYTDNKVLWEWRKTVIEGKTVRHSGSIILQNEARQNALTWNFFEAWPRKWEGPAMNAKNNEVAIETLELVCERIELGE